MCKSWSPASMTSTSTSTNTNTNTRVTLTPAAMALTMSTGRPWMAGVPAVSRRVRQMRTRPVDRWAELVDSPVDLLISGMLADTPEGRERRQNSPFAGALTQGERLAAIERANQE